MYCRLGKSIYRDLFVGLDEKIPLQNGRWVTGINFDNAATTPPFTSVMQEIINFAPWYSSIHRGMGYKSTISTNQYEKSRQVILDFVKADKKYYTVIFGKNTTEAINKLSYRLCEDKKNYIILSTSMEHHSNDLPWRNKYKVDYIDIDKYGRLCLYDLENKLIKYKGNVKLVTITGASNVTGYINPIHKVAEITHKYNAKILVDGAQLVPHAFVDMKPVDSPEHIDYLVFSAHKMYAPFGTGVLIAPKKLFEKGSPEYVGGGTVQFVTKDFVKWGNVPSKEEAGTPNVMGAIALSAAIKTLNCIGMDNIYKYENNLLRYALINLKKVPDLKLYCNYNNLNNMISIIPFNIKGIPHNVLAKSLSCESGIEVRNGCFCAQPYIKRLLNVNLNEINGNHPGMVRISFSIYNDFNEIDILIKSLINISENKDKYLKKYS